jgi:hypothetical protein
VVSTALVRANVLVLVEIVFRALVCPLASLTKVSFSFYFSTLRNSLINVPPFRTHFSGVMISGANCTDMCSQVNWRQ